MPDAQSSLEEELRTDVGAPVEIDVAARALRDVGEEIGVVGELEVAADGVLEPVVVEFLREAVGAAARHRRVGAVDVASEVAERP